LSGTTIALSILSMEKKDETIASVHEEVKSVPPLEPALENVSDIEEDDLDDLDGRV
jgi:hypothetical protein